MAKVGDQTIRVEDFQRAAKRFRLRYPDQTPREILQALIDRKIMGLEAYRKGLERDPEVMAAVERARVRRLTEKVYEEEVTRKVVVSEEESYAYFEKHGLDRKREVRASHIMVETLEEAQRVRRQLIEGADFEKLAREVSRDTVTAVKGGDMGYWKEESARMSPFVRQLFTLNVGEISEPYRNPRGGYHLIKATEERAIGFDQQKKNIQRILERQKKNERWHAYLDEQAMGFHLIVDQGTLSFLLDQGRLSVDRIPTIPPQDQDRVLLRYDGGEVDLRGYVDMVRSARIGRRPAPVDSAEVTQFVWYRALTTMLLPKVAQGRGWDTTDQMRSYLRGKREEAMVELTRRLEVEDRILTEEVLRAYYERHQEDFLEPAQTFVEGGIVGSKEDAFEITARVLDGEDLAEVMKAYPMLLGRWRKYDVFQFSPSDTSHGKGERGEMIEAARGVGAGEIKGPIQITFEGGVGYVVLHVIEVRPARLLPFDDPLVQQTIRRKVQNERREEINVLFERYMNDLRESYGERIIVYDHVLESVICE